MNDTHYLHSPNSICFFCQQRTTMYPVLCNNPFKTTPQILSSLSSSTNTITERSRLIPLQNLSETLSKIGHPHRHPRQLGGGIKSKQRNTRQKPIRV